MTTGCAHVLGAGVSGCAAAEWLLRHGWMVIVSDDAINPALEKVAERLRGIGAQVFLGGHKGALGRAAELVVVSPGIPPASPAILSRTQEGAEVLSELELGWRQSRGSFCAVTGANGKSTTTALLGEIFRATGRPSFTVGNIGTPLISVADQTTSDCLIALEVSSYQLETICDFKPLVAGLLNITPDHLERHGSLESYARAKARVWLNQTAEEWVVFNADDPVVVGLVASAKSHRIPFSTAGPLTWGAWREEGEFIIKLPDIPEFRLQKSLSRLPGRHNDANVLAAATMGLLAGATPLAVAEGVAFFTGLPHRLETVRVLDGVTYINDSKATNVDAGRGALEAVPAPVILLAGGRPKGGGFGVLRALVEERVKRLILFGEAASEIQRDLGAGTPVERVSDVKAAVIAARKSAAVGDTVLLSPLCASFDQFRNFEERGDRFRELVMGLSVESDQVIK